MYPFSFEALVCPQRPLTHLCVLFSFRAFVRPERPVIHLYVVVLFRCEAFVCPQKRLRHLLVLFSCRILVPPERPVIHLVCTRIGSRSIRGSRVPTKTSHTSLCIVLFLIFRAPRKTCDTSLFIRSLSI